MFINRSTYFNTFIKMVFSSQYLFKYFQNCQYVLSTCTYSSTFYLSTGLTSSLLLIRHFFLQLKSTVYRHFSYFSMKAYVVGTHQKHLSETYTVGTQYLTEALLTSTHVPQHTIFNLITAHYPISAQQATFVFSNLKDYNQCTFIYFFTL